MLLNVRAVTLLSGLLLTGCGYNQTNYSHSNLSLCNTDAQQVKTLSQERKGGYMSKSGSRIPAPKVGPISVNGIRFEQVKNGLVVGFDQMGGYLAAYDEAGDTQLWTLKVYDNKRNALREGDVQDIFFKSIILHDDGILLIENENSAKFLVDINSRSVKPTP
jgi:hypothetical protein